MLPRHETRFGAQAHEVRLGRYTPERTARTHDELLLRGVHERWTRPGGAHAPAANPWFENCRAAPGARRQPAVGRRHVPPRHTEAFVHARHVALAERLRQERERRLQVRRWRQLLVLEARLLLRLSRLERRLAQGRARKPGRVTLALALSQRARE